MKEEINRILDLLETLRNELDGSGVIDEIENAVVEVAEKNNIKLN